MLIPAQACAEFRRTPDVARQIHFYRQTCLNVVRANQGSGARKSASAAIAAGPAC